MNCFGIPGIGGSLGQCAFCGKSFIADMLTGQKFQAFTVDNARMAAHTECWEKHGKSEPKDWPAGPLKSAYDEAMAKEVA